MLGTLFSLLGLGVAGAIDNHRNSRAQVFKRMRAKEQQDYLDLIARKRREGIIIDYATGVDQNGKCWKLESRWSVERELSGK